MFTFEPQQNLYQKVLCLKKVLSKNIQHTVCCVKKQKKLCVKFFLAYSSILRSHCKLNLGIKNIPYSCSTA